MSPEPDPRRRRAPHRRAVVASGAAIKLDDKAEVARYRRRSSLSFWQERAWIYHAEIPELYFAHNFVRNTLSRVRLVPAIESDDPEAPPVPLDDETTPDGLDPDVCLAILDRLQPWPNLMGSIALALDVVGECYVALIPDDDEISGERCRVLSNDELLVKDGFYLKEDPTDQMGRELPSDIVLFRLWQPDGRWSSLPMSPMRAMLSIADELMLLTQMLRGIARSRVAMNAGLLWISDDVSLESAAPDDGSHTEDAGDGEARNDPFIEDFMQAAVAAMTDHESAAAALPIILRGSGNPDELIKHIDIARPLEETFIKIRAELIGRLANGLDLPREISTGVGLSTTHATADQIKEQLWHDHLEPRALSIVSGITQAYYRQELLAKGVDPELVRRCCVWYDPSWFLGSPDLSESADQGFADYNVSREAWRRSKGWSEDDAPDEEEIDYRIEIKQRENATVAPDGSTPEPAPNPFAPPAAPDTAEGAPADQGDAQVDVPDASPNGNGQKPKAMVAAGARPTLDTLGARLVNIERDLRTRLIQLADATMARALERAGMKVKGKLQGRMNDQQLRAAIAQAEAQPRDVARQQKIELDVSKRAMAEQVVGRQVADVPSILGRAAVVSLGLEDEALLTGALGDLEVRYHQLVRRSQHAAARAAAQAARNDIDVDALDAKTEDHRNAGWALFAAGLTTLAYGLLYDPHPQAPAVGEFDESTLVPPGLVRAALDRAGGAVDVRVDGDTRPSGAGATGGPAVLDEFKAQLGIIDDRYTWVYGDAPRHTFEPHLELDGVTFTSWDDDVLACTDDWPPVDHYQIGDHEGCQCSVDIDFTQADAEPMVASATDIHDHVPIDPVTGSTDAQDDDAGDLVPAALRD